MNQEKTLMLSPLEDLVDSRVLESLPKRRLSPVGKTERKEDDRGWERPDIAYLGRFWSFVDVKGDDDCWNWIIGKDHDGYGKFTFRCKRVQAHRMAAFIFYGPYPKELKVCHTCDNPACCNPLHLFIGTHQDNMDDKVRKGRQYRGEQQWGSRLSEKDVVMIRSLWKMGTHPRQLELQFGVSRGAIDKIIYNINWRHLLQPEPAQQEVSTPGKP